MGLEIDIVVTHGLGDLGEKSLTSDLDLRKLTGETQNKERKVVVMSLSFTFGVRRRGLIMIVECKDVVLLPLPRENVVGVAIRSLGELVEETVTRLDLKILTRIQSQTEFFGECGQRLTASLVLYVSVDRATHGQHRNSDKNKESQIVRALFHDYRVKRGSESRTRGKKSARPRGKQLPRILNLFSPNSKPKTPNSRKLSRFAAHSE